MLNKHQRPPEETPFGVSPASRELDLKSKLLQTYKQIVLVSLGLPALALGGVMYLLWGLRQGLIELQDVTGEAPEAVRFLTSLEAHQSLLSVVALLLGGAFGAATLMGYLIAQQGATRVVQPVQRLLEGAKNLASGKQQGDLPVESADELGQLARAFNSLRVSLALAEMKYRSLFAHTGNNMLLLDPDRFTILDSNKAFATGTGLKRREVEGMEVVRLVVEEDRKKLRSALHTAIKKGHAAEEGLRLELPNEDQRIVNVTISLIQAASERILELTCIDVTEQHLKNQELAEYAFKDNLTGLFNQRSFQRRLELETKSALEKGHPLALLFIDLDNFKACNDTFGHQTGDEILRRVGRCIDKNTRRADDAGFRYGGDEFGVLLPQAPLAIARRIAEQIKADFFGDDETYGVSMSLGVALFRPEFSVKDFVEAADKALYAAKSSGKDAIVEAP